MNKNKELLSTVLLLSIVLIAILVSFAIYEKAHPEFDETISGKDATVVSEVAKIYYDAPTGRNTGTVTDRKSVV